MGMRAADERAVATMRMRATAPLAALAFPAALLIAAALVTALAGGSAGVWLLALSAPTFLIAAVALGEFPSIAVVVVTAVASGPLWMLAGRVVAARVAMRGAAWRGFLRTYALICGAWTFVGVATLVALAP